MISRAQRQIEAICAVLAAEKALALVDRKAANLAQMIEQRAEGIRRSAITVVNGAGSRRLRNANRRIRAARKEALKCDHVADQQILQRRNAVLGREQASLQVDGHQALHSNHSDASDAIPTRSGTHRLSEETSRT